MSISATRDPRGQLSGLAYQEIKAHPNRDTRAPKRIPRQMHMQQSVTTQKTPRRIPSLCSTTGVCRWKPVSATGTGAVIRRLLPSSAVLCRPPAKMPHRAAIRTFSPTFADLKFLVHNSLRYSLNGGSAERQNGLQGCAARPLMPFSPALPGGRGYSAQGEIYGQSHDGAASFEAAQRQRCVATEVAPAEARAGVL
jgi:hypothetical protein